MTDPTINPLLADRNSPLGRPPDIHRGRKRWVVVGLAVVLVAGALWALFVPLKSEAWGPCEGNTTALTYDGGEEHCERDAELRITVAAITVVVAPLLAYGVRRWILPADGSRPEQFRGKVLWSGLWALLVGNGWLVFASRVGGLQSNDVTKRMEQLGEGTRVLGAFVPATQIMAGGGVLLAVGLVLGRARAKRLGVKR